MPELPEVETVRRGLERVLVGARVESLWLSGKPMRLLRPIPRRAIERASRGHRVEAVRRWAKYLLIDFEGGGAIVVHLGMTGRLGVVAADAPRPPHTHAIWRLDGGRELRYVDVRRFGLIEAVRRGREHELAELAILGVDPLSREIERLGALLGGARRAVKAFLLDQSRIAGIGNIYACEALFEARIHPAARTDRLAPRRVEALRNAIVTVLERGIQNRGTTFRDYVDSDGLEGANQHALRVYGRAGEPCPRQDGGKVRRVVTQARSTFYCPICQRP
jgi:formamidopyrimidine-DNA glycosylase